MQRATFALLLCSLAAPAAQPIPQSLFDRLEWRNIGPFRGGRVSAVSGVPGDPATFYFGSVGGGVWKTTSAGTVWNPIFDQMKISSIGALAVAPSDPNIIYASTGEADIRSQIGFGDGVYKSTDAGKTWTNIGLRETRQIARILVDPRDPNRVFVAALGHVYGPNPDRGVFQSTDGGRSWRKVLFTTPEVGAADLAWDPANPQVLFATMWNGHRPPWSQYQPIEGPGSGLWKSTDGGDHWTQLTGHGLPTVTWKRSGVAVATGGRRVYAVIDCEKGAGLYRSDDGGVNWFPATSDSRLTGRSWYFSSITVDPKNADVLYVPNVALYRSTDGGVSFKVLKGAPGGDDYHTLWIDPADPRRMILGSDQGTNISVDQGATWSTWYNQPTAQIYHVTTDNRFPYTVYGAQQDSGTAAVMSRTDHWTIDARDWFSVGGGEAGNIAVDPRNQNILYVGDAGGSLVRFDRRTGQAQNITPWPVPGEFGAATRKYRYPWTAPLAWSPVEPGALYFASQVLFKTLDGGLTWKEISPDLTGDTRKDRKMVADRITTENAREQGFGVIYSVAPSPLKAGLLWVGSDTGLLHVTQDDGRTWQNVTPQGLPDWSRVTCIEASHFDAGSAYATVDRHRMEDYHPYLYRTRDYGKSWTLLVDGLSEPAYLNAVREDPAHKGLLYAATELGVTVSFDDGAHWQPLQLNLPTVSVRDLVVHGDDLVIATHGRGFWILDNMTPLRQVDENAEVILYKPATAIRTNPEGFMGTPIPVDEPQAKNPPAGAILDYYFRSAPANAKLEILSANGTVIRSIAPAAPHLPHPPVAIADIWLTDPPALTARAGMNRYVWDLHYGPPESAEPDELDRPMPGPLVLPGTYRVRLTAGGKSYTQSLVVKQDPRSTATSLELAKQHDLSLQCLKALSKAAELTKGVEAQQKGAKTGEAIADAERAATSLKSIVSQLSAALSVAQSADRTPPAVAYTLYQQAAKELGALKMP